MTGQVTRGPTGGAGVPIRLAALCLFQLATVGNSATAEPPAVLPREVMASLAGDLFAALDHDRVRARSNPDAAQVLVDRVLEPHFDREYAARLVLGVHWRAASDAQQLRFATAFYRTLLRTYAAEVVEWTPERLKILPLNTDPAALQALVRTEVTQPSHALVHVDYRLHSTATGWRIFDVVVDGVSYARSYHDDVDAEVRRNGLDAAIVGLEARAGAARRSPTAAPSRVDPR